MGGGGGGGGEHDLIHDSDLQEMFGVNCRTESYPGGARFFDKRVILLKIVIFL